MSRADKTWKNRDKPVRIVNLIIPKVKLGVTVTNKIMQSG